MHGRIATAQSAKDCNAISLQASEKRVHALQCDLAAVEAHAAGETSYKEAAVSDALHLQTQLAEVCLWWFAMPLLCLVLLRADLRLSMPAKRCSGPSSWCWCGQQPKLFQLHPASFVIWEVT
jgi:hypothetical protein